MFEFKRVRSVIHRVLDGVQVVPAEQHSQLAFLSGPSFAAEVAEGKPTGLTIAARVSTGHCKPAACMYLLE